MSLWDPTKLREALELAAQAGSMTFELPSYEDALRFRYALYNFRSKTGVGIGLRLEVKDNSVVLTRMPDISIRAEDGSSVPFSEPSDTDAAS